MDGFVSVYFVCFCITTLDCAYAPVSLLDLGSSIMSMHVLYHYLLIHFGNLGAPNPMSVVVLRKATE